jgi:biopolymer transport protein ExbD
MLRDGSAAMNIRIEEEENIELPIVPMIDCAFLLLVFFLIATTLKKPDDSENQAKVYSITVPAAESPQTVSTVDAKRILVAADGRVIRDKAPKGSEVYQSLADLVTELGQYRTDVAAKGKDPVVVIMGDKTTPFQRIVTVWNAVRNAGIRQVSFAVDSGAMEAR